MEKLLQKEVDRIAKIKNYKENYGAKFKISILLSPIEDKSTESHKIILSVLRGNINRSRIIFPKVSVHDYTNLENEIEFLLNSFYRKKIMTGNIITLIVFSLAILILVILIYITIKGRT